MMMVTESLFFPMSPMEVAAIFNRIKFTLFIFSKNLDILVMISLIQSLMKLNIYSLCPENV
jgi:hypothetical protein